MCSGWTRGSSHIVLLDHALLLTVKNALLLRAHSLVARPPPAFLGADHLPSHAVLLFPSRVAHEAQPEIRPVRAVLSWPFSRQLRSLLFAGLLRMFSAVPSNALSADAASHTCRSRNSCSPRVFRPKLQPHAGARHLVGSRCCTRHGVFSGTHIDTSPTPVRTCPGLLRFVLWCWYATQHRPRHSGICTHHRPGDTSTAWSPAAAIAICTVSQHSGTDFFSPMLLELAPISSHACTCR